MSTNPQPPILRAANYDENATFGDLASIFKWMVENHIRYSRTSPPIANDVSEGTFVWDKTLKRLYTKSDNTLRYVQFT